MSKFQNIEQCKKYEVNLIFKIAKWNKFIKINAFLLKFLQIHENIYEIESVHINYIK